MNGRIVRMQAEIVGLGVRVHTTLVSRHDSIRCVHSPQPRLNGAQTEVRPLASKAYFGEVELPIEQGRTPEERPGEGRR